MGRRGFRTFSHSKHEQTESKHRFEHGYRDNTVYFITSKVRDGYFAFQSDEALRIFWDRFDYWTVRARIVADYRDYPHTHVKIPLDVGIKRALELDAFMTGFPYDRYDNKRGGAR